jgi:hypothetical protein
MLFIGLVVATPIIPKCHGLLGAESEQLGHVVTLMDQYST